MTENKNKISGNQITEDELNQYVATAQTFMKDHHDQYKLYTRLVLSLSTGSLALLVSFHKQFPNNQDESNHLGYLYLLSICFLFVSSLFGVLLQHFLKDRYLEEARKIGRMIEKHLDKSDQDSTEGRKALTRLGLIHNPLWCEKLSYSLQISLFLFSYIPLVIFLFLFYSPT